MGQLGHGVTGVGEEGQVAGVAPEDRGLGQMAQGEVAKCFAAMNEGELPEGLKRIGLEKYITMSNSSLKV